MCGSAEDLFNYPFQSPHLLESFVFCVFTTSSFSFNRWCLWILPKLVFLQAVFFFTVNFFQKVNSKLSLPTLQKSPEWTKYQTLFQYKLPLCQTLPSFFMCISIEQLLFRKLPCMGLKYSKWAFKIFSQTRLGHNGYPAINKNKVPSLSSQLQASNPLQRTVNWSSLTCQFQLVSLDCGHQKHCVKKD